MPFTQKTLNAFEMTGRMAACEIPAVTPEHRGFIGVYPPIKQRDHWLIHRFEVPASLVNEYFGEEDLVVNRYIRLKSLQEVEAVLATWGIDPAALDPPWKIDYPLWLFSLTWFASGISMP
jgi:hypothetical protein